MGKLNDKIFESFSGRVGQIVGYKWRGINILRMRPVKKSKSKPSVRQLEQREKFGVVVGFLNPLKAVVGAYFREPDKSRSRFNLAVSYHLNHAVVPKPAGGFSLDYSRVLISMGELRCLEKATVLPQPGQILALSWTDNSAQGFAAANDLMVAVVHSPALHSSQIFNPAATRADAMAQLNLPAVYSGAEVHIWGTMVSADHQEAAISTYLGAVIVG